MDTSHWFVAFMGCKEVTLLLAEENAIDCSHSFVKMPYWHSNECWLDLGTKTNSVWQSYFIFFFLQSFANRNDKGEKLMGEEFSEIIGMHSTWQGWFLNLGSKSERPLLQLHEGKLEVTFSYFFWRTALKCLFMPAKQMEGNSAIFCLPCCLSHTQWFFIGPKKL